MSLGRLSAWFFIASCLVFTSMPVSAEYYLTYSAPPPIQYKRHVVHHICHVHKHKKAVHKKYKPHKKIHHKYSPRAGWYQQGYWVNGHWIAGHYLGQGFNVYPRDNHRHVTPIQKRNYNQDMATGDDNTLINPDMNIDY